MTRTGGDGGSARGRMRAHSTPEAVSRISLSAAGALILVGDFGEAVKTGNIGKWHSLFSKIARGDRQTAHFGRSAFRLTLEGQVFERGDAYVVGMKGQK